MRPSLISDLQIKIKIAVRGKDKISKVTPGFLGVNIMYRLVVLITGHDVGLQSPPFACHGCEPWGDVKRLKCDFYYDVLLQGFSVSEPQNKTFSNPRF